MDVGTLSKMVAEGAAMRRRQRLQPVGGKGDKIFPPTYPGDGRNNPPPQHAFERRQLNGREAWCVLVDSVQSQANRLEESLLGLIGGGEVHIPHVFVDFSNYGLAGISKITSLDAPHRVYDAIFRDSLLDGKPFMEGMLGQDLAKANYVNASALIQTSPTALLFGCWHSTGQGGGLGAKFARCLVSEIVAIDVPVDELTDPRTGEVETRTAGRRTGSRIDPLGVLRKVEVFKGANGWDLTETKAGKNAKKVRPSEINHGNIAPTVQRLGITCDYLEHTFVLSFAALRRLHFGSPEKDATGRTLLAALGLMALAEQDARGYALRSRCDLVCEGKAPLEQIQADGTATGLNAFDTHALYQEAFQTAENAGIELTKVPIELKPQEKLVQIVRKSQELALQGHGGEDGEADAAS